MTPPVNMNSIAFLSLEFLMTKVKFLPLNLAQNFLASLLLINGQFYTKTNRERLVVSPF